MVSRAQFRFMGNVALRISKNSLANYQQVGFEEFVNTDSSVFIRKIAFLPFEFCQYIITGIQQIITQSSLIIITIIAIILFNAKLFLLLLILLLPPVIVIFYIIKNRLAKTRNNIRMNNETSFKYLLDALKGFVESNIYNRNEFFLQRFLNSRLHFSKALFESMSMQTMPPRIIEIFAVMGLFILITIANWAGNADSNTLITIGAFMAAAYKIIPGIVKIINANGQIRAYEFSTNELSEINSTEISGNNTIKPGISSIQLKDISFSYPAKHVLKGFDLQVNKGDFVGITGESGKGKTTILNLVLGFLKPETGKIFINDELVSTRNIKKYWPGISYVRQQPFFIYDTLTRNITLGEEGYDRESLEYAIKVSGLNDLIGDSPEGLNKLITENGKNISGGQQQRIAIARALYKKGDLILLDEPFNELDEVSTISILDHIKSLTNSGKIVILVTHDKLSLSYCNKIISLDDI
jgi:ABC-type bacteriocin/lantibiotic exporter with double-glycine peptidase domain